MRAPVIYYSRSSVTVVTDKATYDYRSKFWVVKVNPRLLMPYFRKVDPASIYINGRKRGWGEYRVGLPPIRECTYWAKGPAKRLQLLLQSWFAYGCPPGRGSYYRVKVGKVVFVVCPRYSERKELFCDVYDLYKQEKVGQIIFGANFEYAWPRVLVDGVHNSLLAIMGYLVRTVVPQRLGQVNSFRIPVKYFER